MSKRTIELTVGLFVLIGVAAFVLLAVKVSGLNDIYDSDEGYYLTADFENVGGLKSRARVSIAGVPVGRVVEIKFDQEKYLATVKLSIDKHINNLPDDTTASILTSGLLGDNYIGLNPGFNETFLKEGGHIMLENTSKAVVLEELLSKFLAGQASGI